MKKLKGSEIRQMWLEFFKSKGHTDIGGVSLVPHDDPTLLWINSGVAAIKRYFDGSEVPVSKRLTNVQKSIRTNDIENVGYTARHHTFFEMLGNFSIGDYFRKEAIEWAYEILTSEKYFAFDKDKIYATYNPSDEESRNLWIRQGLKEDHLIPLEGNYWQIGNGPCGPNTEVFYDRGEHYDPEHLGVELLRQEKENDRYIEIWGIVFSQYNGIEGQPRSTYKELPSKNIDTGAGLERLACIMQNTPTNFETDLFFPIITATEKLAKVGYADSKFRPYRVIADHIRTLTFALGDHASFSNVGRGYVLRRLLRRALRYGRRIGIDHAFLYQLVDVVVDIMQGYYKNLVEEKERIRKIIKAEEEKFLVTLAHGESLIKKIIEDKHYVSGEDAFRLYDTYGFPVELSVEIAKEAGITVNIAEFSALMEKQKELARSSRKNENSMSQQSEDLLKFTVSSRFHYSYEPVQGKVIALFSHGVKVDELKDEGEVIFNVTNFYAESGGQVADIGFIKNNETLAEVIDVQKAPHGQNLHHVSLSYGSLKVGDVLTLEINVQKRILTMRNHSSLHLLQRALIEVLGSHIRQQGSFVNESYARFDFSHPYKVSDAEISQIEAKVNEYISQAWPRKVEILSLEEAKQSGAISLADEKYYDFVRVVSFGEISKEFCGGTHVGNTSDIGVFVIASEESISSGIRRIVVKTSFEAYHHLKQKEQQLIEIRNKIGVKSIGEISEKIKSILSEVEDAKIELERFKNKTADQIAASVKVAFFTPLGDVVMHKIDGINKEILMLVYDRIKVRFKTPFVFLAAESDTEKPLILSLASTWTEKGYKAGVLLKEIVPLLQGSGGGKNDLAFGAAKDFGRLEESLNLLKGKISG